MADQPFALLTELQDRLEWVLSEDEARVAEAALIDASDLACLYGREWTLANVPRQVKTLILRAVVEYMRNPDGFTTSRAGDETVTWADKGKRGTFTFDEEDIKLLAQMAGKTGSAFGTATIVAHGSGKRQRPEGYVPVTGGGKGFPLFSSDTSPW